MANQLCVGCGKELSDDEQSAINLLKRTIPGPKFVVEVICDECVITHPRRK